MSTKLDVGEIIVSNAQFVWKINIVDELKSTTTDRDQICSLKFSRPSSNDEIHSWHLSLYPNGHKKSLEGYMALFLISDNDIEVTVTYTLSLMTNNRELIQTSKYENRKLKARTGYGTYTFIYKNFLLNPINNLIKDNKITILCTIIGESNSNDMNQTNSCQLTNESIFENNKYSDLTIVAADGVKFCLHKCILAAQSNVFEAMFDSDMLEKKENSVKIDDFDSLVLGEFFKYLYTGNFDKERVRDLLIVAEKYNVKKLKDQCEDSMGLNVKVDQAIEYFKVADMHSAKKLRSNMIRYMASNLEELQDVSDFKTLTAEDFQEIVECHFKLLRE